MEGCDLSDNRLAVLSICCRYYMIGGDHNIAGKLSRNLAYQNVQIKCKMQLLRNLS